MFKVTVLFCICAYFLSGCASPDQKVAPATVAAAAAAPAKPVAATPPTAKTGTQIVACVNGKDERVVEIVVPQAPSTSAPNRVCDVMYTKNSKAEPIASSNVSLVFCQEVVKKIKTNLETGGFSCKS